MCASEEFLPRAARPDPTGPDLRLPFAFPLCRAVFTVHPAVRAGPSARRELRGPRDTAIRALVPVEHSKAAAGPRSRGLFSARHRHRVVIPKSSLPPFSPLLVSSRLRLLPHILHQQPYPRVSGALVQIRSQLVGDAVPAPGVDRRLRPDPSQQRWRRTARRSCWRRCSTSCSRWGATTP
jgi:hypothetical protein